MANKEKTIIIENVLVKGYIMDGKNKTKPFEYDKKSFSAQALEKIFEEVGRIYK